MNLLSSSICMLEEADLLAFDEDLQNVSDVYWEASDDSRTEVRSEEGTGLATHFLSAPTSPPRKRPLETAVPLSTPPSLRRKLGTPPPLATPDSQMDTNEQRLDIARSWDDGDDAPSTPKSRPACAAAQLSPSLCLLSNDADDIASIIQSSSSCATDLPGIFIAESTNAHTVSSSRTSKETRLGNNLVRRITFKSPSKEEQPVTTGSNCKGVRGVQPSLIRSANPFRTVKPPLGSMESLRIINRMVNKKLLETKSKSRSSSSGRAQDRPVRPAAAPLPAPNAQPASASAPMPVPAPLSVPPVVPMPPVAPVLASVPFQPAPALCPANPPNWGLGRQKFGELQKFGGLAGSTLLPCNNLCSGSSSSSSFCTLSGAPASPTSLSASPNVLVSSHGRASSTLTQKVGVERTSGTLSLAASGAVNFTFRVPSAE